ncbi:MAG: carbonic anhydrase, partial [Chloroflexota bacterium]|nr:carbonic anhydrase [Chloroflexota bacterium]
LRDGATHPGHLGALVEAISPAVQPVLDRPGDTEANAVQANVRHAVSRLRRAAPILADLVSDGKLDVVGGVYDLATGRVELLSV